MFSWIVDPRRPCKSKTAMDNFCGGRGLAAAVLRFVVLLVTSLSVSSTAADGMSTYLYCGFLFFAFLCITYVEIRIYSSLILSVPDEKSCVHLWGGEMGITPMPPFCRDTQRKQSASMKIHNNTLLLFSRRDSVVCITTQLLADASFRRLPICLHQLPPPYWRYIMLQQCNVENSRVLANYCAYQWNNTTVEVHGLHITLA